MSARRKPPPPYNARVVPCRRRVRRGGALSPCRPPGASRGALSPCRRRARRGGALSPCRPVSSPGASRGALSPVSGPCRRRAASRGALSPCRRRARRGARSARVDPCRRRARRGARQPVSSPGASRGALSPCRPVFVGEGESSGSALYARACRRSRASWARSARFRPLWRCRRRVPGPGPALRRRVPRSARPVSSPGAVNPIQAALALSPAFSVPQTRAKVRSSGSPLCGPAAHARR